MESRMLKTLKSQNPEKDYPSNMGQKWTVEEENLLLDELDKNIDIKIIAETLGAKPAFLSPPPCLNHSRPFTPSHIYQRSK